MHCWASGSHLIKERLAFIAKSHAHEPLAQQHSLRCKNNEILTLLLTQNNTNLLQTSTRNVQTQVRCSFMTIHAQAKLHLLF